MSRLTQHGVQWLVAMVLGSVGFAHELYTTRNTKVMAICLGMIGSRYVFDKGDAA